ncbi:MAG TPA: trypsin-like peptidase domain-containing protein [Bacteroidia bacterium]|nr:trypsin-like peptidase domain-containing protein [Bacteroidia bacterium]HRU66948.1 trypsin-like peptidase domain-containing protein [Bacteroidia bacterium]
MNNIKKYGVLVLLAFVSGIAGSYTFRYFSKENHKEYFTKAEDIPVRSTSQTISTGPIELNDMFAKASEIAGPAVVFIKATQEGQQNNYSSWDLFFNFFYNSGPVTNTGSGVIISDDGYIATNHHVVQNADKIEVVVLNRKKTYQAELVGSDPSTDLALLKIKATELPYLSFGNSDNVRIGDWVIAVGNPFNLTSTVTSGIVSAKGRNISINRDNFPIESFIQTDAAINPGNSGGALVNLQGQLIGINAAIISKTGSYAGYGFAIPSNIVYKIVNDLREYGIVQRAFIELEVSDIDEQMASKLNDIFIKGVVITKVYETGNAMKSGLQKDDIILKMDNLNIADKAAYDEKLAYHRPGDKVTLDVLRNGKVQKITVVLVNSEGLNAVLKNNMVVSEKLGASFREISKMDKDRFGIDYGVKVANVKAGLMRNLGITNDFIILSVNNQKFSDPKELVQVLENFKGWITIKGISPEGWMVTRSMRIY